jgi:acetyl esterase
MKKANGIEGRTYHERGKLVTVLARWNGKGPWNVLIKRCDGSEVIRPFRGPRKPVPSALQAPP